MFDTGSEILNDLLELLAVTGEVIIPGYNLLTKYGSKLAGKISKETYEWWERRGKRVLYGIDEYTQDQLLRKLSTFLGADLVDAVSGKNPARLTIRLDTYEALWSDRSLKDGPGSLLFDDWIQLLVQDLPGVLFVITGRDRLRWGQIRSDWNTLLDQHLLGGLSSNDFDRFLLKQQVMDLAIRAAMIEGASSDEENDSATTITLVACHTIWSSRPRPIGT